jgi:transposase
MISFQTYNEIHFLREHKHLSIARIARRLHLGACTVRKWLARNRYEPRKATRRASILDPYKAMIRRDLELGGCTTKEIVGHLREAGYTGGTTILKTYLCGLRQIDHSDNRRQLLPSEWMLRLLQGKMDLQSILADCHKLTRDDAVELLNRIISGSLRTRNRALAVLAHQKGIPNVAISRFLMLGQRTVSRCLREYDKKGLDGLATYHRTGELKHEQQYYKDAVFALLHSPPIDHGVNRTSWRMDDLKCVLKDECVLINKDSIRHIIRDAGYRFRSAKKILTSTDSRYKEKLAEVTRVLSTLTESQRFFSIDEFGPFAVKIQGGRALTGPDQQRTVPQWQKNKGSLTLVGALELSTNQITHFYSDKKNTAEMIKLMHLILRQYQDQSLLYLSWDAASWHASKAFLQEVARVNDEDYRMTNHGPSIALVPLPASAQFLNVIESVFSGMARAIIHNSDYDSVEECKKAIDRYLDERNESFKAHPKRAGKKIWGKERCPSVFCSSNNCKDPHFR